MARDDFLAGQLWTLEGRHVETGNLVPLGGWEEWEVGPTDMIASSLGWFDAADYDA